MTESKHRHLERMLDSFDTAFLVTQGTKGPHARPLAIARVEGPTVVWFLTRADSEKVVEIEFDPNVLVTFQRPGEFVALRGSARVVRDRVAIAELWSDSHRVWFPQGLDDPLLAAIRVVADHAELWDQSASKGVGFFAEAIASQLGGTPPSEPRGIHEELHPAAGRPRG